MKELDDGKDVTWYDLDDFLKAKVGGLPVVPAKIPASEAWCITAWLSARLG